jgi:hypothetical protein
MSDKPSEIVLEGWAQDHFETATKFLLDYAEKIKEGYVLKTDTTNVHEVATFIGLPRCVMVLEGSDKPKPEINVVMKPEDSSVEGDTPVEVETSSEVVDGNVLDRIESTTKKKDLLDLAKELDIKIPEDKKVPAAIKQFMLNQYK